MRSRSIPSALAASSVKPALLLFALGTACSSSSAGSVPPDAAPVDAANGHDAPTTRDAGTFTDASVDGHAPADAREASSPEASADDTGTHHDAADGGAAEASACGDIDTSTHNCGACGHDCLGAPCSGGVCAPSATLAAPSSSNRYFVVDSTYIYYGTSGGGAAQVERTRKDGTGATEVLATLGTSTFGFGSFCGVFLVDGELVYLTQETPTITVSAISIAGGATRTLDSFPEGDGFVCAAGAGHVYYTPSNHGGGAILKSVTLGGASVPDGGQPDGGDGAGIDGGVDGGFGGPTVIAGVTLSIPAGMFASATTPTVYIADNFYDFDGQIPPNYLVTVPTGAPSTMTKVSFGQTIIAAVTADYAILETAGTCTLGSDSSYTCSGGAIERYDLAAGVTSTVASIAPPGVTPQPYSADPRYSAYGPPLAVYGEAIVWLDGTNMWELRDGSSAPLFLGSLDAASPLVLDESYVYFVSSDSTIERVAR